MREALNSNPLAQAAVMGVLLLMAAFFFMTKMGGGAEEEEGAGQSSESIVSAVAATEAGAGPIPPGALAAAAPPPPPAVTAAFEANETVALLFVHDGGIDDRLVRESVGQLEALPAVATFVVPANRIARYAAIAQGVDVDRVPALVVVRPKHLDKGIPTASVTYGFQSPESAVQAIRDAGYKGRTLEYHP
jgi:hypothetical protein